MDFKTRVRILIGAVALTAVSSVAVAHNGIEHVMGTVIATTATSITVETTKHTRVTVMVESSTTFTNKDAKAALPDLKVGNRVVIDAKEAADEKLRAISVRWGAGSKLSLHNHDKQ